MLWPDWPLIWNWEKEVYLWMYFSMLGLITVPLFTPENHQTCSGGGACVILRSLELYWCKLQLLAGLTKPGSSKGRIQTNRWSNCWQQGEGSAHRQIQPGIFWLRVTIVLGRILRLLVGVASINSQSATERKLWWIILHKTLATSTVMQINKSRVLLLLVWQRTKS